MECITNKYPSGDERLETEIKHLKRKLDRIDDECRDCDENELIQVLEKVEAEQTVWKKKNLNILVTFVGKLSIKNTIKLDLL